VVDFIDDTCDIFVPWYFTVLYPADLEVILNLNFETQSSPPSAIAHTRVCVFCLIKLISGNHHGSESLCPPGSLEFSILTLHLYYVAGYIHPLLFIFKRTQQLFFFNLRVFIKE